MLPTAMFVGVAGGEERQEHLVFPAEIIGDDVDAAFDIVEDHAVMLAHPARRAAGAAGVDQAGEVIAADRRHCGGERRDIGRAIDQRLPIVELRDVGRLAGEDVVDRDDVIARRGEQHRGDQRLGQFLGRDDHRARLAIAQNMLVIAGGVGDVGRDGDTARGHDRKVGDQPFGAVLADQHDPVAGVHPEPFEPVRQRRDLPCGLRPTDRFPSPGRLGPQEGRVALFPRAREEHRHQIGKMFELLFQNPLPAGFARSRERGV